MSRSPARPRLPFAGSLCIPGPERACTAMRANSSRSSSRECSPTTRPCIRPGCTCTSAGDALVEGADYSHQGKNEGTEDVVLLATYVIAEGEPLAQTDLRKCD